MKYKIIVDKQSRKNPSNEKREYLIDIEELRVQGDIYDSLIITKEKDYVMRRLSLSKFGVLTALEEPMQEDIPDLNIQLFEGDNYIYLVDMEGNKFYAEYLVKNDFTDTYVTKSEMNSSIEQKAGQIELSVTKELSNYTETTKLGTWITQNWEYIRIAWNQISEFIQLMILNENATLAILDKNNNIMMSLDKEGQHFYKDNNTVFGEMGVQKANKQEYISFSMEGEYEKDIENGVAWGIKTKSDEQFHPILFLDEFNTGPKNSDAATGNLRLSSCNMLLDGLGTGIVTGGVKIYGDPSGYGLYFTQIENMGNTILAIQPGRTFNIPGVPDEYTSIYFLDNISFFHNQAGTNSLRVGSEDSCSLLTDEGYMSCNELYARDEISCNNLQVFEHIYCNNGVQPFSLAEKKKNIEKYNNQALDEIKDTDIFYYNYNEDDSNCKKRIGAIIGNEYKCSKEIIGTEGKGIDLYSMVSIAWKAIQEQQKQIEMLEKRVQELEGRITNGNT